MSALSRRHPRTSCLCFKKPAASRGVATPAALVSFPGRTTLSLRVHASSRVESITPPSYRPSCASTWSTPNWRSPVRPSGEAGRYSNGAVRPGLAAGARPFAPEGRRSPRWKNGLLDDRARAVALRSGAAAEAQLHRSRTRRRGVVPGRTAPAATPVHLKQLRGSDGKPSWGVSRMQLPVGRPRGRASGSAAPPPIAAAPRRPRCSRRGSARCRWCPPCAGSTPRTGRHRRGLASVGTGGGAALGLVKAGSGRCIAARIARAPRDRRSGRCRDGSSSRPAPRAFGTASAGRRLAQRRDAPGARAGLRAGGRRTGDGASARTRRCATACTTKAAAAARDAQIAAEAEAATPGLSGSTAWKGMAAKRSVVKLPHARAKQEECLYTQRGRQNAAAPPARRRARRRRVVRPHGQTAGRREPRRRRAVRVFDASTGARTTRSSRGTPQPYTTCNGPPSVPGGCTPPGTTASACGLRRAGDARARQHATRRRGARASARDGRGRRRRGGGERVRHRRAARVRVLLRGVAPAAGGVLATGARDGGVGRGPPRTPAAAAARAMRRWSPPSCVGALAATANSFDRTGLRLWVGFADGVVREHGVDIAGGGAGDAAPPAVAARVQGAAGRADHLPTRRAHRPAAVCAHRRRPRRRRGRELLRRDAHLRLRRGARASRHPWRRRWRRRRARGARKARSPARRRAARRPPGARWRVSRSPPTALDGRRRRPETARRSLRRGRRGLRVALPAAGAPPGVRVNDVAWSPRHCVAVCAAGGARPLRLAAHAEQARAVAPAAAPAGAGDSEANRGGVPRARGGRHEAAARSAGSSARRRRARGGRSCPPSSPHRLCARCSPRCAWRSPQRARAGTASAAPGRRRPRGERKPARRARRTAVRGRLTRHLPRSARRAVHAGGAGNRRRQKRQRAGSAAAAAQRQATTQSARGRPAKNSAPRSTSTRTEGASAGGSPLARSGRAAESALPRAY